jgi:DNA-binding transcriptional MerR regulator
VGKNSDNPKFTASDARKLGGISYRQLNGWDSKGALPSQRKQGSGWRKFDPKQFFVILVCAEIRKQFGVPLQKLAWLQKFMLQDGANHFSAAVKKMRYGLAVLILTDLRQQFDMDSDSAIGDLLDMGYCRYDEPQSYVLLLVNPLINKMLVMLQKPMRLEISDTAYDALSDARAALRVRDTAELEVLRLMRQPNVSKITVTQTNDKEVLLEIDENAERDGTVQKDQIPAEQHEKEQAAMISRKVVKKVAKEEIGIIAVRMKN